MAIMAPEELLANSPGDVTMRSLRTIRIIRRGPRGATRPLALQAMAERTVLAALQLLAASALVAVLVQAEVRQARDFPQPDIARVAGRCGLTCLSAHLP